MIRVLLVDDHPVVRTGYLRLLEQTGEIAVVGEAGDAVEAYASFREKRPDVTVADLSLPGTGGVELIRKMLQHDPKARVLAFSMHEDPPLVRRVLDAGALGFIGKGAAPDQLVDAVRAVHSGERYLAPDMQSSTERQARLEAMKLASLSPREFEVFQLLARGASPAECAWRLALSPKTVSNLQWLIKEKLGVSSTTALVHLALRNAVVSV
ncbi:MAG TPA: response regulator transcription factor [Burkholderiales bacterium]|jgi:DNA-binding NarL/FixJ family response regulator